MADSKQTGNVPLTELQCRKLEAAELNVTLVKERIVAEVQRKYAVLQAIESRERLAASVEVRAANMRLDAVTNEVLGELTQALPEGHAAVLLEWEKGLAHTEYNPAQATQRLPALEEPVSSPDIPEVAELSVE